MTRATPITVDTARLPLLLTELRLPTVNRLLFGPPGTGKSHLAAALGDALVAAGYRVLFTRTTDLVQKLQGARRDLALPAAIDKLDKSRAVVVRRVPFTIRLKDRTGGVVQPVRLKVDPGSKVTGMALVRDGADGTQHASKPIRSMPPIRRNWQPSAILAATREAARIRERRAHLFAEHRPDVVRTYMGQRPINTPRSAWLASAPFLEDSSLDRLSTVEKSVCALPARELRAHMAKRPAGTPRPVWRLRAVPAPAGGYIATIAATAATRLGDRGSGGRTSSLRMLRRTTPPPATAFGRRRDEHLRNRQRQRIIAAITVREPRCSTTPATLMLPPALASVPPVTHLVSPRPRLGAW